MRFEEAKEYSEMGYYIWVCTEPTNVYYTRDNKDYIMDIANCVPYEIDLDYHTGTYSKNMNWFVSMECPYVSIVYPEVVIP